MSWLIKNTRNLLLNELSQPGNVVIIGKGRIPDVPAKPNRKLIILFGLLGWFSFWLWFYSC